jgi:CubicO group peptidase (beta-lactamase class C family)
MLAGMHKTDPVTQILTDSRAMVAKTGTRVVVLLPVDWMRWTEALQKGGQEIAGRAKQELGATALEVHISGAGTPAAKEGLGAYGWTVKERVVAGLTNPPAD